MQRLIFVIVMTLLVTIASGCRENMYYEKEAALTVSVESIELEASDSLGGSISYQFQVKSNRSWSADLRNPMSAETEVNWACISPEEAEYPSNTSFYQNVNLLVSPNINTESRVCELVFHALGGEVIVPIKQKGIL